MHEASSYYFLKQKKIAAKKKSRGENTNLDPLASMCGDAGLAVVIVAPTRRRSVFENATRVVPARVQLLPGSRYRHRNLLVIVSAPAHHCPIRGIRAGVLVDVGKEAGMPLEPV